ncbi:hypothetical protein KR215_007982 [Drosophila sulfurigaster]|nr:hypothetical protein KR215_007982 [Drosophila sulfurigaster]
MQTLSGNFLKLQVKYFRVIGFDIIGSKRNWLQPWKTIVLMVGVSITQFMVVSFSIVNFEDIEKLTDALTAMIMNHLSLLKYGLIIWLRNDFRRIIHEFHKILAKEYKSEIAARIIDQENRRDQRISSVYANCFLLAAVLSASKPIMRLLLLVVTSAEVQLEMNIPCYYFWDNRKLHNFLISCGILSIASFGVVLSTIALDTFYVSLTHNLVALFKTAQYKMQFFAVTTPQETNDRLRDIIYLYKVSLDMSNRLKYFFRLLICIQMVLTSVHLCVLNFTLSYNFGQPQMFFYIVFIIAVLIQLLIYCHCGEYLKTTSQGFAVAIYDSPWYETIAVNPAIGRYLQISMMRSQRAIQIDGYFFDANMEVFLSIVMTAMSYLTLLRSVS